MCVLTYSLLFGISVSGNFSLQPSFFPLVIDKWCFETAGGKSRDLPRPVYKNKSPFGASACLVLPGFGFTSFVEEMTDGSITTCL